MNAQAGVYALKNTMTGRCYVGSSVDLARRKRIHFRQLRNGSHGSLKLSRSWAKHGEAAFQFVVLELTSRDETLLRAAEQVWIDRLDAVARGYNTNPVAGNVGLMPKSVEHRARIGTARTGKTHSAETKALLSVLAKQRVRRPMSNETKARISASNSGKVRTADMRARLSQARTGLKVGPMTAQHRAAISAGKRAAAQKES